jgi:DNA-binding transcriptional LysR family regulator
MVSLGAEADAAVRAARGAAEPLRLVATSTLAEFVAAPLIEAFAAITGNTVETTTGVAQGAEMPVLLAHRLADVALGPRVTGGADLHLHSEPVFRARLVAVTAAHQGLGGSAARWTWLVDAAGTDEASDTSRLLHRLSVPEERVRVFPSQTAAWESAAAGHGVAVAIAHLVGGRLRRRELRLVETPATPMASDWYVTSLDAEHRTAAVSSFRQFLASPRAMAQMREPGAGVPPSKFRPPVHVTIWA